jgi:hypothetical protein
VTGPSPLGVDPVDRASVVHTNDRMHVSRIHTACSGQPENDQGGGPVAMRAQMAGHRLPCSIGPHWPAFGIFGCAESRAQPTAGPGGSIRLRHWILTDIYGCSRRRPSRPALQHAAGHVDAIDPVTGASQITVDLLYPVSGSKSSAERVMDIASIQPPDASSHGVCGATRIGKPAEHAAAVSGKYAFQSLLSPRRGVPQPTGRIPVSTDLNQRKPRHRHRHRHRHRGGVCRRVGEVGCRGGGQPPLHGPIRGARRGLRALSTGRDRGDAGGVRRRVGEVGCRGGGQPPPHPPVWRGIR